MNEQQRQAFEDYERSLNFFDESEFERIGEDYAGYNLQSDWKLWQAALAQREPVDGEASQYAGFLRLMLTKHALSDKDVEYAATLLERTEKARLAAEENYQAATLRANANAEMFKSLQLENDALRAELAEEKIRSLAMKELAFVLFELAVKLAPEYALEFANKLGGINLQ